MGGYGAALYCGTGCFHRRESLCGKRYSKGDKVQWNIEREKDADRTVNDLEESSKVLASCSYEKGTQWGKEVILYLLYPIHHQNFKIFSLNYDYNVYEYTDGTDIWLSC